MIPERIYPHDRQLIRSIAYYEGYRSVVYWDTKGKPTIGYGFNLDVPHTQQALRDHGYDIDDLKQGAPIKHLDAYNILVSLLRVACEDALELFPNLYEYPISVQRVFVDMSYNLGKTKLSAFKRLRAAVAAKDWDQIVAEMIDSNWYHDVGRRSRSLVSQVQAARPT